MSPDIEKNDELRHLAMPGRPVPTQMRCTRVDVHIVHIALVFREISCCFSSSPENILHCKRDILSQRLHLHGLDVASCSIAEARRILTFHLMFGLCCVGRGERCSSLANSAPQRDVVLSVLENLTALCRCLVVREAELRFICSAIGLTLRSDMRPVDILAHMHSEAMFFFRSACSIDLLSLFRDIEKMPKHDLYGWCSAHCIYPSGTMRDVRKLLLTHVLSNKCHSSSSSELTVGCLNTHLQRINSFADADMSAYPLSVLCLINGVHRNTLYLALEVTTGHSPASDCSLQSLQAKLRQYIFDLRRGQAIFYSVLFTLRSTNNMCQFNEIRNSWPSITDPHLKEEVKMQFEQELLEVCKQKVVCACCSIAYGSSELVLTEVCEIDLGLLIKSDSDESAIRSSTIVNDGLLAEYLLDSRGIVYAETSENVQLRLCDVCHRALRRSRIPQFALANYFVMGDVPPELLNLSPVEESMIALCRARCIMVQLKSMRRSDVNSSTSQRGFRGHTIFHQQDVSKLATLLPPSLEEILAPICVLFIGSRKPTLEWIREHAKPLVVRAHVVRRALKWLIANNPLYAAVRVNDAVLLQIEREGGLMYDVLCAEDKDASNTTVCSYADFVPSVPSTDRDEPIHHIAFENVVITDLDQSATPHDMRAAALRHLRSGKPFFLYSHSSSPQSEYRNSDLFPSLYPTLFPYGTGGFEDTRRYPKVSMRAQARHLLNIADDRFRKHPSFIFSVFNVLQRREVGLRTMMRVNRASFESKARVYASLKPETLQSVADRLEKGEVTFQDENEKEVADLMRDVRLINSTVQGSSAARWTMRNELRAMIVSLGAPSFFITVNPADVYNPVVNLLAGDEIDIHRLLPQDIPSYHMQSILIAKDPVLAARFFHIYIKAFIQIILGYDENDATQITPRLLGLTKAYYGIVEAQGRGTLHCHFLLWLEGGLNPAEIAARILHDNDHDFEARLIGYLDDNISTAVPDDPGDVSDVPSNRCNPCSVRPILCHADESEESYQLRRLKDLHNLANQCQRHSHNDGCYKYWKGHPEKKVCRFDLDECKRTEKTFVNRESGEICGRVLDGLVNPFNDTMLEILRCNMDIKFIGSGESAHAVLYYVTDYISKTQLKTHAAYNILELALHRLNTYDHDDEESNPSQRGKKVLLKCANAIIAEQELSAQQVASYLLDNGDHYTSHQFKPLYWQNFVQYINHFFRDVSMDNDETQNAPICETARSPESQRNTMHSDVASEIFAPVNMQRNDVHGSLSSDMLESDADIERNNLQDLLSDPLTGTLSDVATVFDRAGNLIPKTTHVADYVYRPDIMQDVCLWDFLSFSIRECQTRIRRTAEIDDNLVNKHDDNSDDDYDSGKDYDVHENQHINIGSTTQQFSDEGRGPTPVSIPFLESMFRKQLPSSTFSFRKEHPDHESHRLRIVSPHEKYILVPTGPSLPRLDRPDTKEAYCRLMLILFKPWLTALDLKSPADSWHDAYSQFVTSNEVRYEHYLIMKNIQFLHECRDCRNRDYDKRKSKMSLTYATDSTMDPVTADMSSALDENDLDLVQSKNDEILRDILRQVHANEAQKDDCLKAISLAHLSIPDCDSSLTPCNIDNGSTNLITNESLSFLRSQWKAEYSTRRKNMKSFLQSDCATIACSDNSLTSVTLLGDFTHASPDTGNIGNSPSIGIASTPLSQSHDALRQSICDHWTLNDDQKRAFNIVCDHVSGYGNKEPLRMLISGPAGSGKTRIINALRHFFVSKNEGSRLRVTSYMGIAANNVSGITLHSALNLTHADFASKSIDELKYMWAGVDYLIIDEISMISCEFLQTISVALGRATGLTDIPFGGLNVIFAGDLAQLPPVGETRLSSYIDPSRGAGTERGQQRLKGKLLWLSVSTVVLLQKNNRQSGIENVRFVELLTRLRDGNCNTSDYQLLLSRVVTAERNILEWNLHPSKLIPIIVCNNSTKDAINLAMANSFAQKNNQRLISFTSFDENNGMPLTDRSLLNIVDVLHSGKTSGRLKNLPLCLGMPVMVTTNIDVPGGIVNGSMGTIRSFDYKTLSNGEHILNHCIVHIPTATAAQMPGLGDHEYPIMPDTIYIRVRASKSKQMITIKRTQVPLIHAFAITAHKLQGQTIDKAVVDLAACHGTEAPYVMLSRVRRLDDLLILRAFPISKIRCRLSEDSRREQTRIYFHHLTTMLRYGTPQEQELATTELAKQKKKNSQDELDCAVRISSLTDSLASKDSRLSKKRRIS